MSLNSKLVSLESEQVWLGTMITFDMPDLILEHGMCTEHFSSSYHQSIFTACNRLYNKRIGVDLITLKQELESMKWLDRAGGFQYIIEICKSTSKTNMKHHAEVIKLKYKNRKAHEVMLDAINLLSEDGNLDLDSVISSLMSTATTESNYEFDSSGVINSAMKELDRSMSGIYEGVKYGIGSLDGATGGAHNDDLIIIAAKPAMGKTALLLNMMINAMNSDNDIGFISAEMPVGQIGMRIACTNSGVNAHKARKGELNEKEVESFKNGLSMLNSVNLRVYEKSAPTISDVERMAKKWKHQYNIKALYVDYVQRIKGSNPSAQRWEQVGEVVMRLKDLARELQIPVICLAQVNRGVDTRQDKRPELGDIANSAEIEKEADQIMTIYRDEVYNDKTDKKGIAEIDFKKNRHGPTGCVEIQWTAKYMKFHDLSENY